jgi:hypothetical protein
VMQFKMGTQGCIYFAWAKWQIDLSPANITAKAMPKYSLGRYDLSDLWEEIRHHPLYVASVRESAVGIIRQIRLADSGRGHYGDDAITFGRLDPHKLAGGFEKLRGDGLVISAEVGYKGDWQDIIISAQQHPLVIELLKIRDEEKEK